MGGVPSQQEKKLQSPLREASPFQRNINAPSTPGGVITFWKRSKDKSERTPLLGNVLGSSSLVDYGGSVALKGGPNPEDQGTLSFYGAIFTILNIFLGLGVLSLPYAFEKGKVWSAVFLIIVAGVGYITGKMLVDVAVEVDKYNYGAVALILFGEKGMAMVTLFVSLEFFGATIMTTIFLWNNIFYLIRGHYFWIALLSGILCTPTVWLLNFSEMSFLNIIGVASNIIFVFTTILLAFFKTDTFAVPTELPAAAEFSMGMGIFVLCFAGHACLTGVYTSMKEPQRFPSALKIAFVSMVLIYCAVGFSGIILYGEDTDPLLTRNMTTWPGGFVSKLVTLLIVLRSYVSIAPLLGVAAEIQENLVFGIEKPQHKRIFRTVLLWMFVIVSYLCSNNIDYVEAITGSIASIVTVFVFPPMFYLKLYPDVDIFSKVGIWVLILVSIILGAFLTVVDVYDLMYPYEIVNAS